MPMVVKERNIILKEDIIATADIVATNSCLFQHLSDCCHLQGCPLQTWLW